MQGFSDHPRERMSRAQVLKLLQDSAGVQIGFGADLLDLDLRYLQEIPLFSGSVKRNYLANIHGSCDLELDTEIDWPNQLVRPWMDFSYAGLTGRFHVGVFSLTTPLSEYGERARGERARRLRVQGYDRLYLLSRQVGNMHVAPAGAGVLAEVRRIIALAGITGVQISSTKEGVTLPEAKIWPHIPWEDPDLARYEKKAGYEEERVNEPSTYLRVANDLLKLVGYRGLYADPATGILRSEPHVDPQDRPIEFTFRFDDLKSVIAQPRTLEEDRFKAPNHFTFIRQNMPGASPPEPTEANGGLYIVDKTVGDARTLRWPTQVSLDVADYASLVAEGNAHVARERRLESKMKVATAPWPLAGHGDVYHYVDVEMGLDAKVLEGAWDLNLNGADMTREWELFR